MKKWDRHDFWINFVHLWRKFKRKLKVTTKIIQYFIVIKIYKFYFNMPTKVNLYFSLVNFFVNVYILCHQIFKTKNFKSTDFLNIGVSDMGKIEPEGIS